MFSEVMPPAAVKTVRDLILWQYAKIISDSAGMGKKKWAFVMDRFRKLQQEEIFWNEIREYVKEREKRDECIFCGASSRLTMEHLFPRSLNGPDDEKNIVWVCPKCNSSKGARTPYEFWALEHGLDGAKYDVPRIAEGKYLKLLYEVFMHNGMLDLDISGLKAKVCPVCDMKGLCVKEDSEGRLSPLCLDGIAKLSFQNARSVAK